MIATLVRRSEWVPYPFQRIGCRNLGSHAAAGWGLSNANCALRRYPQNTPRPSKRDEFTGRRLLTCVAKNLANSVIKSLHQKRKLDTVRVPLPKFLYFYFRYLLCLIAEEGSRNSPQHHEILTIFFCSSPEYPHWYPHAILMHREEIKTLEKAHFVDDRAVKLAPYTLIMVTWSRLAIT
jgi:hypothetical protein